MKCPLIQSLLERFFFGLTINIMAKWT